MAQIRGYWKAEPFRPFEIQMSDGRVHRILSPLKRKYLNAGDTDFKLPRRTSRRCWCRMPMPRRELKDPKQVEDWLVELSAQLTQRGDLILIGSGGLLWHAFQRGITEPLPEQSMDVDPITSSDEVARACYEALIGSEFELRHGWHVNLMPESVLREFPADWEARASRKGYGLLDVVVPAAADLLAPKLKRGEPRDRAHERWARRIGLVA